MHKSNTPSIGNQRNFTVDLIRLICAFGVIAIHVKSNTPSAALITDIFWPVCVPFFFIISLVYFINGLPNQSVKQILVKIWYRIAIPFLSWTVIYSILILIKRTSKGLPVDFIAWRVILYGESAVQLYFLPSLILMQVYVLSVYLILKRNSKNIVIGLILLLAAVAYHLVGYLNNCFELSAPGTFIAFPLFIIFALWVSLKHKEGNNKALFILAGTAIFIAAVVSNCYGYKCIIYGYPFIILIGGIGLSIFAIGLPNMRETWVAKASATSYGIYLSHVLFLEAFEVIIQKYYHVDIQYTFIIKVLFVTAVFFASMTFTLLIKKIPLLSIMLLGNKRVK